MRIEETELPEFVIAFRGYDRAQVDDYIAQLRRYAGEMEARTQSAESQLSMATGELARARHQLAEAPNVELSPRLGQILALATEEAEDVRRQARDEATASRREAMEAAQEMQRRGRDETQRMLDEATERQQRIEREIEDLESTRRALLDHLSALADELRDAIAAHTTGVAALAGPAGTDAVAPGTDGGWPSEDDNPPTADEDAPAADDSPLGTDQESPGGAGGAAAGPPASTRAIDGPTVSFPAPDRRVRIAGAVASREPQGGTPLPWAESS